SNNVDSKNVRFTINTTAAPTININSVHIGLSGMNCLTSSYIFRSLTLYQQATNSFTTSSYTGDSGFFEKSTTTSNTVTEDTNTINSPSGGGFFNYTISDKQFQEGYTKQLGENWKISFNINGDFHSLIVNDITKSTVNLIISSEPQKTTLVVGDERKFELNSDNFYDLYIKLNSIENKKANLTIQLVHEEISPETIKKEEKNEEAAEKIYNEENKIKKVIEFLIIVVILILFIIVIIKKRNKRRMLLGY
ncbi:MAG: hypothetical protein AABW81_02960, partial [Nanoarchaeota archaeon]